MNKKIASEIAIGIILLVAIIVGGIFWLQGKKEISAQQTIVPIAQAPTTQPAVQPVTSVDETADWHTYINKTSGYKITFPDTWKGYNVKDAGNGKISFSIKFPYSKDVFADGSSELAMFNVITIPISSQTNQDEIDCKKGEAPAPLCYFVFHRLAKTNDNIIYYERGDEIGDMVQFENKIADIKNRFGEVDSILKTFQLNSTDETANWQTYTNVALGFSFRYPDKKLIIGKIDSSCKNNCSMLIDPKDPKGSTEVAGNLMDFYIERNQDKGYGKDGVAGYAKDNNYVELNSSNNVTWYCVKNRSPESASVSMKECMTVKNSDVYRMGGYFSDKSDYFTENEFDQIIDSFEFTN